MSMAITGAGDDSKSRSRLGLTQTSVLPLGVPSSGPRAIAFLGAGASQFVGYYTFRTFDRLLLSPHVRAENGLPELDSDTERFMGEVRLTLQSIGRPTTHDNYLWLLNNYRDFCVKFKTHAGVQRRFERIHAQIAPFSDAIQHLNGVITRTTLQHYGSDRSLPHEAEEVCDFYRRLARLNSLDNPELRIFTTNYDLLLERLLSSASEGAEHIQLVNGFRGLTQERERWTSALFAESGGGIHIYRLHGCVAWFYHGLTDPDVYFHRRFEDLDWSSNLCAMFPGREIYPGRILMAMLSAGCTRAFFRRPLRYSSASASAMMMSSTAYWLQTQLARDR